MSCKIDDTDTLASPVITHAPVSYLRSSLVGQCTDITQVEGVASVGNGSSNSQRMALALVKRVFTLTMGGGECSLSVREANVDDS